MCLWRRRGKNPQVGSFYLPWRLVPRCFFAASMAAMIKANGSVNTQMAYQKRSSTRDNQPSLKYSPMAVLFFCGAAAWSGPPLLPLPGEVGSEGSISAVGGCIGPRHPTGRARLPLCRRPAANIVWFLLFVNWPLIYSDFVAAHSNSYAAPL